MTIFKTKICSAICFAIMFCCAGFLFSACGNSNGVYTALLDEVDALIEQNTDILNDKCEINISYAPKLQAAIDSSEKYLKLSHSSWKNDVNYGPVLFEPVLIAGLTPFSYYCKKVDFAKLNLSEASANEILSLFRNFATKLNKFAEIKHTLENRSTINVTNSIIQKELDEMCVDYKNLVESACVLGQRFIDIYSNQIFEKKGKQDGRYGLGEMRLFYLTQMNQIACLDYQKDVKYYFDKAFNADYQTNSESLLNYYKQVANLSLWEGTSAAVSEAENRCVQTYEAVLEYNKIFASEKQKVEYALTNVNLAEFFKLNSGNYVSTEFSNETRVYTQKINQFFATHMRNMLNYLITLTQNVKTFQSS